LRFELRGIETEKRKTRPCINRKDGAPGKPTPGKNQYPENQRPENQERGAIEAVLHVIKLSVG
jgi:hypothetical protein